MAFEQQQRSDYRPDIDGLRAVAVLSVLFYHLSPSHLPGGFVGVDIFFVISGYLISSIIYRGLDRETFSFADFYKRRIRRIFPSLIFVLTTCIIAGYVLLTPEEFKSLGFHIFGGSTYSNNLILWSESGYWDGDSNFKPLLHLWSLGVEEQFYLIWPLLLFIAWKCRVKPLGIIVLLIAASFGLTLYEIANDATGAFYSPQTRFWELLSGSLLAWCMMKYKDGMAHFAEAHALRTNIIADVCSVTGFALLIACVCLYSTARFPSEKALLPI